MSPVWIVAKVNNGDNYIRNEDYQDLQEVSILFTIIQSIKSEVL